MNPAYKNAFGFLLVAAVLFLCTVGCTWEQLVNEYKPKLEKLTPVNYQKDGVKIVHPEGWTVSQETLEEGERLVTLEDRYSSIVTLNVANAEEVIDLVESAAMSHEELRKNVPLVSMAKPVKEKTFRDIAGRNYEGTRYTFDISIAGIEEVPHITDYFVAVVGERNVFVTLQAPAEDWPGAEQEFQMILDSIGIGSRDE